MHPPIQLAGKTVRLMVAGQWLVMQEIRDLAADWAKTRAAGFMISALHRIDRLPQAECVPHWPVVGAGVRVSRSCRIFRCVGVGSTIAWFGGWNFVEGSGTLERIQPAREREGECLSGPFDDVVH